MLCVNQSRGVQGNIMEECSVALSQFGAACGYTVLAEVKICTVWWDDEIPLWFTKTHSDCSIVPAGLVHFCPKFVLKGLCAHCITNSVCAGDSHGPDTLSWYSPAFCL